MVSDVSKAMGRKQAGVNFTWIFTTLIFNYYHDRGRDVHEATLVAK